MAAVRATAPVSVDYREKALIAELPGAMSLALPVGDVLVGDGILLERKTVPDLASSIKDGRWRDQLARLVESGARAAVVVEGEIPAGGQEIGLTGVDGDAVRSALAGAFVRDGVPHFRTVCVSDTAALVRAIAYRVARAEGPSSRQSVRMPKRNDNLGDPREVARLQLAVVPGVSRAVASAVLGDSGSLAEWISRWRGRGDDLARVVVGSRRLGPTLAERILSSLGAAGVAA